MIDSLMSAWRTSGEKIYTTWKYRFYDTKYKKKNRKHSNIFLDQLMSHFSPYYELFMLSLVIN